MAQLKFITDNGEETANGLVSIANCTDICGELEDHGGIMGVLRDTSGSKVHWWLALAKTDLISGPALLKFEYSDSNPPSMALMIAIFAVLDMPKVKAQLVGDHKIENYPCWANYEA